MKIGADVIGAIPHFEFTVNTVLNRRTMYLNLHAVHDRLIDVHCDEIDDEQSRFVETLAALAHKFEMGEKVTASPTAMGSYNGAYAFAYSAYWKCLASTSLQNPLVNIHLQGRFDDYPKRRGVTRVKEMLAANINVCFGHDDVFDPW